MKEEYKECPNCHNMTDKSDKECPYCLHQFTIWNSFVWNNNFFEDNTNNENTPLENMSIHPILKSLLGTQNTWTQNLSKQEIIKKLRKVIIIFFIITWLIPTLVGLLSSFFWE